MTFTTKSANADVSRCSKLGDLNRAWVSARASRAYFIQDSRPFLVGRAFCDGASR